MKLVSFEQNGRNRIGALENEINYFISCLENDKKPKNNERAALKVMNFLEKIQNVMNV